MLTEINKARSELLSKLAFASIEGSIGLFIGSGFSKAITCYARDWKQLIVQCALDLEIDLKGIFEDGKSYPEIASSICHKYSQLNRISYEAACSKLKETISANTNWFPHKVENMVPEFGDLLKEINPVWIITTNYDSTLETIMSDGYPIGSKQAFRFKKGKIPIYHLHGHRMEPESIVITQEDYIELFRPGRYSQIKLSTMLKETITLVLGYSLGDVNVLTAFDWAKNVYKEIQHQQEFEFIQINWQPKKSEVKNEPYTMRNNILVLDTDNILSFLKELVESIKIQKYIYKRKLSALKKLNRIFANPDKNLISKFITDYTERQNLIEAIELIQKVDPEPVRQFLKQCLDYVKNESAKYNNFEAYNDWLKIILEVFNQIKIVDIHPTVFNLLADYLDQLSPSIGGSIGKSFSAHKTWNDYQPSLDPKLIQELKAYAKANLRSSLSELLK